MGQVFALADEAFWEKLWAGPAVPVTEIFVHLSAEDLTKIKDTCPKNLATLVRRVRPTRGATGE